MTNNDVMQRVKMLEECISNQNKTIMDLITKVEIMSQSKTTTSDPIVSAGAGGQQQVRPLAP